jgi:4a-hydroxytetrahydrobiopterin dehydratase
MDTPDETVPLTRAAASAAVEAIGWRFLLGSLATSVPVTGLVRAAEVARLAVEGCAELADAHLRADLRPDRVELSLQTRSRGVVTAADVALADAVTAALSAVGASTGGATSGTLVRPVQALEVAIDALDVPAVLPFWRAVLGYVDEPGSGGDDPVDAIVDPAGQLPAVWFQQMDAPRPQRNRVHLDVTVAHDEADARVRAALDAGGVLVDDTHARSFWVLADAEGNEACVCTWTDRDAPG